MTDSGDIWARRQLGRLEQAATIQSQRIDTLQADLEVLRDAVARLTVLYGEGRFVEKPQTGHEPIGRNGSPKRRRAPSRAGSHEDCL